MPDFNLRRDCDDFFRYLFPNGGLRLKFDYYHLCFLLGAGSVRPAAANQSRGETFNDSWPREYDGDKRLIEGLLFAAELRRYGVAADERTTVNAVIARLAGAGGLTAHGAREMNSYASGGFDLLQERYDAEVPRSMEEFLPRYLPILDDAMAGLA